MKKSMLMLTALFMLGACSSKDDNAVDGDWKNAVANKFVYDTASEDYLFQFSPDASEIYMVADISTGDDEEWVVITDTPLNIQSGSTATSATYSATDGEATMAVKFSGLANGKGTYDMGDGDGSFELKDALPESDE